MSTNAATWGAGRSQQNGVFGTIAGIMEAFASARSRRRTAAALADLDDHALMDIGLDPRDVRNSHRSMAEWVVQSHSGTARLVFIGR